ncbi:DUF2752 domain-containing protein [Luteococcus peritonei]|uniref:DUF2752 domain-containing protein n=1 Tax=Luteococcus peritonei TaxID=88874 RepID=A0ABW4RRN4_9ACTN
MSCDAAEPFSSTRALRAVASFAAVCGAQGAAVMLLGRGLPCPLRATTGLLCPLCGATTGGLALLHGHVGQAWAANPFAMLLLAGLALSTLAWTVEALGGPALRPPRRWRPLSGDRVLLVLGIVGLGFALWRNLA